MWLKKTMNILEFEASLDSLLFFLKNITVSKKDFTFGGLSLRELADDAFRTYFWLVTCK